MGCKFSKVRENERNDASVLQINNVSYFEDYDIDIIKKDETDNCNETRENGNNENDKGETRDNTYLCKNVSMINWSEKKQEKGHNHQPYKIKTRETFKEFIPYENRVDLISLDKGGNTFGANGNTHVTTMNMINNEMLETVGNAVVTRKKSVNSNEQNKTKSINVRVNESKGLRVKGRAEKAKVKNPTLEKEIERVTYQQKEKEGTLQKKDTGGVKIKTEKIKEIKKVKKENDKRLKKKIRKNLYKWNESKNEKGTEKDINKKNKKNKNNGRISKEEINRTTQNKEKNMRIHIDSKIPLNGSDSNIKRKKRNKFEKKFFAGIAKTINRFPKRDKYKNEPKETTSGNKFERLFLEKKKDDISGQVSSKGSLMSSSVSNKMLEKDFSTSVHSKQKKHSNMNSRTNKGSDILMYYHDFRNVTLKKNNFMHIYEFYRNNNNVFNHLSMMPSNIATNVKHSLIIFESSIIGKYVMFPWVENDPDIKNNLYLKYVAHYFQKKKNLEKANRYALGNEIPYYDFVNNEIEELFENEKSFDHVKMDSLSNYVNNSPHVLNVEPTHTCKTNKGGGDSRHETPHRSKSKHKAERNNNLMKKKNLILKRKGNLNLSVSKVLRNYNSSNSINSYRRYSSSLSVISLGFAWSKSRRKKFVPKVEQRRREGKEKGIKKEQKKNHWKDTISSIVEKKEIGKGKRETKNIKEGGKQQNSKAADENERSKNRKRSKKNKLNRCENLSHESKIKEKNLHHSANVYHIVEENKEGKHKVEKSLMKVAKKKNSLNVEDEYYENSITRKHFIDAKWKKHHKNKESKNSLMIVKKKRSLIKPTYLLQGGMMEKDYAKRNSIDVIKRETNDSNPFYEKINVKKNEKKVKGRGHKERRQNKEKENMRELKAHENNNLYNSLLFTHGTSMYLEEYRCKKEDQLNVKRLQNIDTSELHKMQYGDVYDKNDVKHKKIKNFTRDRVPFNLKKKKDVNNISDNTNDRFTTVLKNSANSEPVNSENCNHKYRLSENCLKRNFVYCEKCTKKRCVYHYLNNYKLYGWLNYKWTDPDGFLELSKRQQRKFFAWKRLSDLYSNPVVMTSNLCSNCIRQGFVADCSFLSALTVLIEYERKHKINVLSNIISPYAPSYLHPNKTWPVYNPSGMYICRLHCNGVQRKIMIDDFVPVKNNDNLLVAYSNNQQELWVTLLEKAFVKLMGGSYSMFGSNPGSDLYYLTGWIPITISFKSKVSSSPPSIERSVVHSRDISCLRRGIKKNNYLLLYNCKTETGIQTTGKNYKSNDVRKRSRFFHHNKCKNSYLPNSIVVCKKGEFNLNCYRLLRNVNWSVMNCCACKKYNKWKQLWILTKTFRKIFQNNTRIQKSMDRKKRDWELLTTITKKQFLLEPSNRMDYSSYAYISNNNSIYNSGRKSSNISVSSNLNENSVVTDEIENCYDKKWDAIWNNIYDGIKKGKCVVCLGTLELDDAAPSGLDFPEGVSISTGIVTRHAYSILNIETYKGDRLLYVKNPWGCIRWKGKYSHQDEHTWTKELQRKLNYSIDKAKSKDDGCFWIQWKNAVKHFSHIYICWNSSIFPFHVEIHTKWENNVLLKSSILLDDTHLVAYNPQFALHINVKKQDLSEDGNYYIGKKPIEVWILLSRHVNERKTDVSQKYLALHVHAGKNRISCPLFPIKQGVYSNGECTFTKLVVGGMEEDNFDYGLENKNSVIKSEEFLEGLKQNKIRGGGGGGKIYKEGYGDLSPKSGGNISQTSDFGCLRNIDFVLIVSQYSQKEEFNFTLKAFSHTSISLCELPPLLSDKYESTYFRGKWTPKCAGGCSNNLWSYFKNPHIRLFVPEESTFIIFLECEQEHSVNLRIFKGITSSPRTLKKGEVISSGAYRAGCCFIECTLASGIYSLIPSLYKANTTGNYQICIHHSKFKKKPILYFIPYPYVIPPFSFFKYHVSHLYSSNNYSLIFFRITSVTLVSIRVIFFQNLNMKGIPLVNIYKMVEEKNTKSNITGNCRMVNDVENGQLIHNNAFNPKINYNGCVYELVEKCNIHGSTNNNILPISSCAYDFYVKFNSVFISLVELENITSYMLLITTNLGEDVLSSHEAHFISDKPTLIDSLHPSR